MRNMPKLFFKRKPEQRRRDAVGFIRKLKRDRPSLERGICKALHGTQVFSVCPQILEEMKNAIIKEIEK